MCSNVPERSWPLQVLIVDDDQDRRAEMAIAFMHAGFQTTMTGCQVVAECCIRHGFVDLLIMTERVGERLTHSLALLAEYRNPMAETILLTPRSDADIEELFLLLPSLHCLVAPDVAPTLITKLAIASIAGKKNQNNLLVLKPEHQIAGQGVTTPNVSYPRRQVTDRPELHNMACTFATSSDCIAGVQP